MYYECLVYRCVMNSLPALLKRFETVTLRLFEKHGFRPVAFFTTAIGESHQELMYFLEWQSLDQRMTSWRSFRVDPEWLAARVESEKNGQIVQTTSNQILEPTAFSPHPFR